MDICNLKGENKLEIGGKRGKENIFFKK